MSKAGERLLRGAEQALKYAQGRAKPGTYRIYVPASPVAPSTPEPAELPDSVSAECGSDDIKSGSVPEN